MTINSRVKILRSELGLTQKDFGARIPVTQTYLSQIENGDRDVTEKIQKIICSEFSVNSLWLSHGYGNMFGSDEHTLIEQLGHKYHLSEVGQTIMRLYCQLPDSSRFIIEQFIMEVGRTGDIVPLEFDKTSHNTQQAPTDNDIVQIPVASRSGEDTNITMRSEEYEAMEQETLKDLEKLDNSKIP